MAMQLGDKAVCSLNIGLRRLTEVSADRLQKVTLRVLPGSGLMWSKSAVFLRVGDGSSLSPLFEAKFWHIISEYAPPPCVRGFPDVVPQQFPNLRISFSAQTHRYLASPDGPHVPFQRVLPPMVF